MYFVQAHHLEIGSGPPCFAIFCFQGSPKCGCFPCDLQSRAKIAGLVFPCITPRAVLFFFVHVASSSTSRAAFVCVTAIGRLSNWYVGGVVTVTTTSPLMTFQQFRILAALCTCADHVPQLESSSVSMFSFERSMIIFFAFGGSLALKK